MLQAQVPKAQCYRRNYLAHYTSNNIYVIFVTTSELFFFDIYSLRVQKLVLQD